jgi:hypothetical protein
MSREEAAVVTVLKLIVLDDFDCLEFVGWMQIHGSKLNGSGE